jgi:integrase
MTLAISRLLSDSRYSLIARAIMGKQSIASPVLPEIPTMKLTAKTTANATLPAGKMDMIHFDDSLPGFGLRLRSGGGRIVRTWVAQYRAHGRTRRMRIGAFEKLTADQAREAARKILAKVELGGDPQADRQERRHKDARSLRAVVDEYLAAKETSLRPRSLHEVRRYLTQEAYFGVLHSLPIDRIARRDVATRVLVITRETGAPTADRARSALAAFFAWCVSAGIVDANPTIGATRPELPPARDRTLDEHELAMVWRESGKYDYGAIIRLLILLAARRTEIGQMRWAEIDLERGTWELPAERSKNGFKHALPLPQAAIEIISAVPGRADRDYLFGSRADGFTLWSTEKRELDVRLGKAVKPWRVHDLRRSAATRMCDIGIAPHIVEQILNHRSGHKAGVAGIYNLSRYQREVHIALEQWADHIRALVEGSARKVVPMQRPA